MVGKIDFSQSTDLFDRLIKTSEKSTADYNEAAKPINSENREDYADYADTDTDGLYDFEEIAMSSVLVKLDNDKVI